MHLLSESVNKIISGRYSVISIVFSLIIFSLTAFIGAKDSELPLFLILLIVAILMTLMHILVQILEDKDRLISEKDMLLSKYFITKSESKMSSCNLALDYDASALDGEGYFEVNLVLNVFDSPTQPIDLIISSVETLAIKQSNIIIDLFRFNGENIYTINDAFSQSTSSTLFKSTFKIRLPISLRNQKAVLKFKIALNQEEHIYVFSI
ncbi:MULTISPECIES: hypothetical protein [unclassified Exiguobacterium]|uniref:hypothetical protein n=1 Tax=unclassified Exiguobacterium TaxID=2644629 RepID=UPI001BE6A73E|nr:MULTISPECIES: hypothetical protein [unclassified Exiguobacterium]